MGAFASPKGAGLSAEPAAAAPSSAPASQFGVGLGLLALGLVALSGGALVAALRTRPALVRWPSFRRSAD